MTTDLPILSFFGFQTNEFKNKKHTTGIFIPVVCLHYPNLRYAYLLSKPSAVCIYYPDHPLRVFTVRIVRSTRYGEAFFLHPP